MTKINEILTINLQEDIKNVIDLEDQSESEIQQEMESYIVTGGLGQHYYNFFNKFSSNPKETGVWLSGFYGSGKSYFGKMLGHILANPSINGTRARERFISLLKGLKDESLIENIIRKLDSFNIRVVSLDIAKQNTDKGLAFTLFANLLKNLGFRQDIYGFMEFDLFIDNKYDEFKAKVLENENQDWQVLRSNNRVVVKTMRNAFMAMGYSESDYESTRKVYEDAINNFSASKLKDQIDKYLNKVPDQTLVFIFDEASEAISQKKFTLLDLEGLSEVISSIKQKVWLIAIAQEKLNDVINNANVNKSQLGKVTDRFKTKIHLESTEVDVIIRSRLLHKKEACYKQLIEYFNKNEGLISDSTNLNSSFPTRTTSADEFATYYPFHKYQFHVLQKFLFSSNSLVATQIAARGMIITTFDVLRKQMADEQLFAFTPAHSICTEAQTAPPVELVNKYDLATMILQKKNSTIEGRKLLKTIHLLVDSDMVNATAENITKTYITDVTSYYEYKPLIEEALAELVEAKVLMTANNNFKITSDLEGKMLEEMKDFTVELYTKKRHLINALKEYKVFTPVAALNDAGDTFKFTVVSDNDDEICPAGNKQLRLKAYNLFNVTERQNLIETVKTETQYNKDLISLIPDNTEFKKIDKLIGEIIRYNYMESKYANENNNDKRQIIRDFAIIREEKEKELRLKIENAYKNSSLVYIFDENLVSSDTFKAVTTDLQKKLVGNVFTKRLKSQLSESLVKKIFSSRKQDLHRLFPGEDFKFFDTNGNFIGDHLKVVEEVVAKIKTRYTTGRDIESDLANAPWGYSFGTMVSTLAAMFRAGRLAVKYNGSEPYFDYKAKPVHEAFNNATKFKSASFKAITATLTAVQKNEAVQLLLDMEAGDHTGQKIDWSINDYDLASSIVRLAEYFINAISSLKETVNQFEKLFPRVVEQKPVLQKFSAKVTENNYIERVEFFLNNSDELKEAIESIIKAQKFIKKHFDTIKSHKNFIDEVLAVLRKADVKDPAIEEAREEFSSLYAQDMVKNVSQLKNLAQSVKESYFKLIRNAASRMTQEYQLLASKVDAAQRKLKKDYPLELNKVSQKKLESLARYCKERILKEPEIDFSTTCKKSGFSLSDMLNYSALLPSKDTDLQIIESSFVIAQPEIQPPADAGGSQPEAEQQPVAPRQPRKISFQIPAKVLTVQQYKKLLTAQLQALASSTPEEEIEVVIESQG
jgi:hypothetical protein